MHSCLSAYTHFPPVALIDEFKKPFLGKVTIKIMIIFVRHFSTRKVIVVHTYDHTCGNSASKSAGLGSLVSRWIMSVIPPVNRSSSLEASVYIHYSLTATTSIILHHDYINVYYIDIWDNIFLAFGHAHT